MKLGINTFLFTSPFTTENIALFPKFRDWGFESVEIALEDVSHIDAVLVKKALDDNGLVCASICAAMGGGRDLRGDLKDQEGALSYIKQVLDVMPVLGCEVLAGPLYSQVGRAAHTEKGEYARQWDMVAGHLDTLSAYAASGNLRLAIEPLNRYETDFINTCAQSLKMLGTVNNEALFVHLDTYHMNIEEKDPAKAIRDAGNKLGHFHACGSDRGTPGGDQINWDRISSALRDVNYKGSLVIESFTTDVKVIAKAASIWRDFENSKEDIAVSGIQFLQSIR